MSENKTELIQKEDAIEAVMSHNFVSATEKLRVRDRVKAVPALDAVEVVRCKDCVHWKKTEGVMAAREADDPLENCGVCPILIAEMLESDFCCLGKKG